MLRPRRRPPATAAAAARERLPGRRPPARRQPIRRAAVLLAVLAIASALGGCRRSEEAAEAAPPLDPEVRRVFLEAAFGNRYGEPSGRLLRWQGRVRVGVAGDANADDRSRLRRLVGRLDEVLDPLDLRFVASGADADLAAADLVVRYAPLAEIPHDDPPESATGAGWTEWRATGPGRIVGATVWVPSDESFPQYMRDNLTLEGMIAALGLPGAIADHYESALHGPPNWDVVTLAPVDVEALRLAYSPRLRPGMRRSEVEAALDRLTTGTSAPPRGRAPAPAAGASGS